MSTITIPGPLVLNLAEAAQFLLAKSWGPVGDLTAARDSELHPEWW
jgi:hypothetical protein